MRFTFRHLASNTLAKDQRAVHLREMGTPLAMLAQAAQHLRQRAALLEEGPLLECLRRQAEDERRVWRSTVEWLAPFRVPIFANEINKWTQLQGVVFYVRSTLKEKPFYVLMVLPHLPLAHSRPPLWEDSTSLYWYRFTGLVEV